MDPVKKSEVLEIRSMREGSPSHDYGKSTRTLQGGDFFCLLLVEGCPGEVNSLEIYDHRERDLCGLERLSTNHASEWRLLLVVSLWTKDSLLSQI